MKSASQAAAAAANEHLATEILSWLPANSVIRFKFACKAWLYLASDPFFVALHTRRNRNTIVGVTMNSEPIRAASLCNAAVFPDLPKSFLQKLSRPHRLGSYRVISSCNGLVLFETIFMLIEYYLYNPITMQYKHIPGPVSVSSYDVVKMSIAFDPSKYPLYHVVCFCESSDEESGIVIYSSKTGSWGRPHYHPCLADFKMDLVSECVIWNGTLNWARHNGWFQSLDLQSEQIHDALLPPSLHSGFIWRVDYFGESRGHLHVIQSPFEDDDEIPVKFEIWEFKSDRSGWFLLYRFDLSAIWSLHPTFVVENNGSKAFIVPAVTCFIRGGDEEKDDTLILETYNSCVLYDLRRQTLQHLCSDIFAGHKSGFFMSGLMLFSHALASL